MPLASRLHGGKLRLIELRAIDVPPGQTLTHTSENRERQASFVTGASYLVDGGKSAR